jgi:hypothetical protein
MSVLDVGVRGEGEDLAAAARAQDDGTGGDGPDLPGRQLDGHDALTPSVVDEQRRHEELVVAHDRLVLEAGLEQGVEQMEPRLVGGEPGPLDLHPAEGAHRDVAVRLAAPGAAPVLEPEHLLGRLADEGLHRVLVAEPVAAGHGVVGVLVQAVLGLDDGGGASLGRDRVAAHGIDLGDDADAQPRIGLGHGDRRAQARSATAHDEHVAAEEIHDSRRPSWTPGVPGDSTGELALRRGAAPREIGPGSLSRGTAAKDRTGASATTGLVTTGEHALSENPNQGHCALRDRTIHTGEVRAVWAAPAAVSNARSRPHHAARAARGAEAPRRGFQRHRIR